MGIVRLATSVSRIYLRVRVSNLHAAADRLTDVFVLSFADPRVIVLVQISTASSVLCSAGSLLGGKERGMAAAKVEGARLNHISRATPDPKCLAKFYQEVLGFERIESPELGFEVIWLKLPKAPYALHIIEKNPIWKLPEGPSDSKADIDAADAGHLPRGHHLCFDISNYDSFVKALKEKGVKVFETIQADGKTRQAFFFDPDGNGIEVADRAAPQP